jgi:hypothetical protein
MRIRDLDLVGASMQDVFDIVVFMLLKQGGPSLSVNVGCRYRLPREDADTLCCGIGHIIPDAEYTEDMEGKKVGPMLDSALAPSLKAWCDAGGDNRYLRVLFLGHLQSAHDKIAETRIWLALFRDEARAVAHRYGLNDSICSFGEAADSAGQPST